MANPEEMAASMRNNVADKTGKPMADWWQIIKQSGHEKHGQILKMLKTDHGVTHGFANLIAHDFLNQGANEDLDLVTAQYSGAKQDLKIIYDTLMAKLATLEGVEIAPKKAYVSLRRNKQFALIQPSTKTRVDVGINLKGDEPTDRLEASGSFNAMVSHRVRLTEAAQVDDELIAWLQQAYDRS
jgi:predicted transport protein